MRSIALAVAALLAAPAIAQNWYVPDPNAGSSPSCNVIPFGLGVGGGSYQCKYQSKATRADLGALPGLITGLAFAPCASGWAHYYSIEIVLDHHPAGAPLGTNFAANLTPSATTVLFAADHTWHLTANAWNEIGLQRAFAYNGVDDLVVQITTRDGTAPAGFHRDTRQRVHWVATTGTAPAAGYSSPAAAKFEVSMVMARTSTYGFPCAGSTGIPSHAVVGTPLLGTAVSYELRNGLPNGFGLLMFGFTNAAPPWPLELAAAGAPGCWLYHDNIGLVWSGFDGAGTGASPLAIPNDPSLLAVKLLSQYVCVDPAANAAGITTSNYARTLIGN